MAAGRGSGEGREEQEAARREKADVDKAEAAALKKLAEAEADAAAKKRPEEAARRQELVFVVPLNSTPPPPEFVAPTGGASNDHPVIEREGGDVAMRNVDVPPAPPAEGAKDKQPTGSPAPPTGSEMVTGPTPEVRTPSRRRFECSLGTAPVGSRRREIIDPGRRGDQRSTGD